MGAIEEYAEVLGAMPKSQRDAVVERAVKAVGSRLWVPNPGPQTEAYFSEADELLYGGEPGGGKSDLGLGLAFTEHKRTLALRRQYTDLSFLIERAIQINGSHDGFSGQPPPKFRTKGGRHIDFGAAATVGDEQHWMGNPHDLIFVDEATQFARMQVRFLIGWNRTEDPKQRCRVIFCTNPALRPEGLWVNEAFAPWLDDTFPDPARPGELRWFISDVDDSERWVEGPGRYEIKTDSGHRMVEAKSRTYIPAKLEDNPHYVRTGYQKQLDALPESTRRILLGGFRTTFKDQDNQVIPTAWIRAAMARWTMRPPEGVPMCAIGVDASGGGTDPMVLAPRYDGWYAPLVEIPGKDIPAERAGTFAAGIVITHRRDRAGIVVDMGGGYGGPMYEHLKANDIDVVSHKGSEASTLRTKDKQLGFFNKRSQVIWRFREALDPDQPGGSPIFLPDDPILLSDLAAPTLDLAYNGIKVEAKDKIVDRIGRSTNRGDAVVMSWSYGPKAITHALDWATQREQRRPMNRRPQVIMGRQNARR